MMFFVVFVLLLLLLCLGDPIPALRSPMTRVLCRHLCRHYDVRMVTKRCARCGTLFRACPVCAEVVCPDCDHSAVMGEHCLAHHPADPRVRAERPDAGRGGANHPSE